MARSLKSFLAFRFHVSKSVCFSHILLACYIFYPSHHFVFNHSWGITEKHDSVVIAPATYFGGSLFEYLHIIVFHDNIFSCFLSSSQAIVKRVPYGRVQPHFFFSLSIINITILPVGVT
jgi:hypothetical protein